MKMRNHLAFASAFVPHLVWAQNAFENATFNVTQALLDNGVQADKIPNVELIQKKSILDACDVAVRTWKPHQSRLAY